MAGEIKVLLFRGTGAPLTGDGIMKAYAKALGDWADIEWVNYPASYGNPSYDVSFHTGVKMGLDAIRSTPKRAIVMGFSQGADIAGYIHALLNKAVVNTHNYDLSNCFLDGSFLLADPSRHTNAVVLNGAVGGWGIRGMRPVGEKSWSVANPGDPICAYPNGPLRSFADFSAYFGDPEAVGKIRLLAEQKRLQPWWKQPNPVDWFRNWGGTVGWLNNYASGFHTDQYYTKGLVQLLADKTNQEIERVLL